jgi:hypothetical protein
MSVTGGCSVGVGVCETVGDGVSVGVSVGVLVGRTTRVGGVGFGSVYVDVGTTVTVGIGKHSPSSGGEHADTPAHMRRPTTTPLKKLKMLCGRLLTPGENKSFKIAASAVIRVAITAIWTSVIRYQSRQ